MGIYQCFSLFQIYVEVGIRPNKMDPVDTTINFIFNITISRKTYSKKFSLKVNRHNQDIKHGHLILIFYLYK